VITFTLGIHQKERKKKNIQSTKKKRSITAADPQERSSGDSTRNDPQERSSGDSTRNDPQERSSGDSTRNDPQERSSGDSTRNDPQERSSGDSINQKRIVLFQGIKRKIRKN
jgi:hypothetical protein